MEDVCIVTFPIGYEGSTALTNLASLLSELVNKVYLVSSGDLLQKLKLSRNVLVFKVYHRVSSNTVMRIINYIHTQLKILRYVIKVSKRANMFIFFLGGEGLLIPILILKLLRKKTLLIFSEVAIKVYPNRNDSLSKFIPLLIKFDSNLVDGLVVYSKRLILEGKLARYQHKIIVTHRHFVNFNTFMMQKRINERTNVVGYIGRLSEEKGVLNFVKAIPLVLKEDGGIRFIICGAGALSSKIKKIVKCEGLDAHVELIRWIPHKDIPRYLNQLKLIVLPSFTEGLPNILLEAMACGTPVLATSVGGIPDVVVEGKTGFLLKSTRPEHIAERIAVLLSNPNLLERVSERAYKFVREKFRYEKTLEIWRNVIKELGTSTGT